MTWPPGEPRAYVERDFPMDRVKVHLATRAGNGNLFVLQGDGVIREYQPGEAPAADYSNPPYLQLTDGLAHALLDALAAHFGGTSEVQTLRKDYIHERGRVDKMIDHLTKIREEQQ